MTPKQRRASLIRRSHRSLGASAAIFIIFMVISGIIINHSHSLELDRRHLSASYLLEWYGLAGPEKIVSYELGEDWLSFAGSQVFLNDSGVSNISNAVGATRYQDMFIIAATDELLLLDKTGQLIERQSWENHGTKPIESIGLLTGGAVVLKSGQVNWQADTDFIAWNPTVDARVEPDWSAPTPTPQNLEQAITRQYRGEGPSLERLLLDLHSGRFFGPVGVLIYDLIALALGFLAISGLVLWARGRRNGKYISKR